jgi:nucleoside-diphosphate-sugar epimerase
MSRALITGAAGFVGSNLARRLVEDGHDVHLVLRPAHAVWRIEAIRHLSSLHIVDLNDPNAVAASVDTIRPDWVFHLAVHGAYSSQADVHEMVRTNIMATINLVDACIRTGVAAMVNTGSSSEYGLKDHAPHEAEWLEPNSPYAVTKATATMYCRYVAQQHGIHLPTLRLYSVYGPYEEPTRLMPTLVVRGLQGTFPPLVEAEIARDYVYVHDVIEAYLLAATHPTSELGAVYNVGTGVQTSLGEVVDLARRVMCIAEGPNWGSMPRRQWDTPCWVGDSGKIRQALNWQSQYTVERGFSELVDWFRQHPSLRTFYEERQPGTSRRSTSERR